MIYLDNSASTQIREEVLNVISHELKYSFANPSSPYKPARKSRISINIMNTTFNEVIMRSINTSLTSIIPELSLILVGNYLGLQGALADFAIPLFIGMISGTYSSIFVTVPFISRLLTK